MFMSTIPEFYAGKCILITGANGFLGKILVEKLLRSCSELETIYLLMRARRDKNGEERWKDTTQSMVFDRLRKERPGILEKKVEVVEGDGKELRLGLNLDSYKLLQEKVQIVFHVAASVRFNDPLAESVFINLRGTHELVKLALGMPKLQVFVHVSTTYCYCYLTETKEKIYPPQADWRDMIKVAENLDKRESAILSQKYIGNFPNTYTFTKNLTEAMLSDYKDRLPLVIIRPSIVISSLHEPIPGWLDNINGPIGLILAGSTGIIRIALSDKDTIPDYIPADIAIKSMLIAAWKKVQCPDTNPIPIYNVASRSRSISNGEMMELFMEYNNKLPTMTMLWLPNVRLTKSKTWYKINAIFLHLLPAIVIDQLLKLFKKKPMLMVLQQRFQTASLALRCFTTTSWIFANENFRSLNNIILADDKKDFDIDISAFSIRKYFNAACRVGKMTILNEDEDEVMPRARKHLKRLKLLDAITTITIRSAAVFLFCSYFL